MAMSKYKSNFSSTEGHEQERDSWRFVSVNERKFVAPLSYTQAIITAFNVIARGNEVQA
jgi:hypothetical protein